MAPDEPKPRVPWLPVTEGAQPPAPAQPWTPAAPAAPAASTGPAAPAAPAHPPVPPEAFETTQPDLTPAKPPLPAWIRRDATPEPIDLDEGELVPAVQLPPAEEVLPSPVDGIAIPEDTAPPAAPQRSADPLHLLGEAAATNAYLNASGAPTPLGGVPVVEPIAGVETPEFGDDAPRFTPRFAPASMPAEPTPATPVSPPTATPQTADSIAAGLVAHEQAELVAQAPAFDAVSIYSPVSFAERPTTVTPPIADTAATTVMPTTPPATAPLPTAPLPTAPMPGATSPADPATASDQEPPAKKRRWWLWVLIALVVIGGGATAYAYFNKPDPIVEPGTVVTMSPPAATIEPIAAPTASAFQSAMPTIAGTFSLVEAQAVDVEELVDTAGRVADAVDLAYRSGENTMKVRALQYYNEQEATAYFEALVGETAQVSPVEVGGTQVGDSAVVLQPKPGIVWRNGTSLFILTGPPLELTGFFESFGL